MGTAIALVVALALTASAKGGAPRVFDDSRGYLFAARQPLDATFWLGSAAPVVVGEQTRPEDALFRSRPFLLPLLYKVLAGVPERIVVAQTALFSLCVGVAIALSVAGATRPVALVFAIGGAWVGLAWWVGGWTQALLTESLGFGLILVVVAALGRALRRSESSSLVVAGVAAVALLALRDAAATLLVPLFLGALVIAKRTERARLGLVFAGVVGLSLGAVGLAARAGRDQLPLLNVYFHRLAADPAAASWFAARGLEPPARASGLVGRYAFEQELELFRAPENAAFLRDFRARFRALYLEYLVTHPRYLAREVATAWSVTSSGKIDAYVGARPARLPIVPGARAFLSLGLAAVVVACGWGLAERGAGGAWAVALLGAAAVHAALAFVADAAEPERHTLSARLVTQWAVLVAGAALAERWSSPARERPLS